MTGGSESDLPCKLCEQWDRDEKIAEARKKYDPGPLFDEEAL